MSEAMDTAGQGTPLPPHSPANMLSLYMTQYDYDYNRDGHCSGSGTAGSGGDAEPEMSGEVRNRPIFAYGSADGDRDARTIYQVDYTAKDRTVKDMHRLAMSLTGGKGQGDVAVTGGIRSSSSGDGAVPSGGPAADTGTAYQREWYRPGLTPALRNDDGTLPQTAYQEDYRRHGGVASRGDEVAVPPHPASAQAVKTDAPPVHAGAAATAYNRDLLKPHGVEEDDGHDVTPKVTSEEAARLRGATLPVTRSAGPSSTLGPGGAHPGMYSCTSWDIGDASMAHSSQLPISLSHSIAAAGVDVTATADKAALLRQLASKNAAHKAAAAGSSGSRGGTLRNEHDRTNPQLLSTQAQKTCAVSRRLEEEHHVHMSMYKSDYVNQAQLPELPGNPAGPADVRDTRTSPTATTGEMMAGQLTKQTRVMGQMRNAHGTLKSSAAAAAAVDGGTAVPVEAVAPASMRATELANEIDRADPHRHKLRS